MDRDEKRNMKKLILILMFSICCTDRIIEKKKIINATNNTIQYDHQNLQLMKNKITKGE